MGVCSERQPRRWNRTTAPSRRETQNHQYRAAPPTRRRPPRSRSSESPGRRATVRAAPLVLVCIKFAVVHKTGGPASSRTRRRGSGVRVLDPDTRRLWLPRRRWFLAVWIEARTARAPSRRLHQIDLARERPLPINGTCVRIELTSRRWRGGHGSHTARTGRHHPDRGPQAGLARREFGADLHSTIPPAAVGRVARRQLRNYTAGPASVRPFSPLCTTHRPS